MPKKLIEVADDTSVHSNPGYPEIMPIRQKLSRKTKLWPIPHNNRKVKNGSRNVIKQEIKMKTKDGMSYIKTIYHFNEK